MSIRTTCTCGKRIRAHDAFAGQEVKCARCGKMVRLPVPQPAAKRSPSGAIEVACPCGRVLRARPSLVGRRVACPQCGKPVAIPSDEPPPVTEVPLAVGLGLHDVGTELPTAAGGLSFDEEMIPDAILEASVGPAAIPKARSGGRQGIKQSTLILAVVGGGVFLVVAMMCAGVVLLVPKMLASMRHELVVATDERMAAAARPWQTYQPPGLGFSVMMPGKPALEHGSNGSDSFSVDLGTQTYLVGVHPIAGASNGSSASDQTLLDAIVAGVPAEFHVTALRQNALTLEGHHGVEFSYKPDNQYVTTHRAYIVDGKLYQVVYVSHVAITSEANAARFFDSFKFTAG